MICFAWWGFPQYAARCVGAFVSYATEDVSVVATRPAVPVSGMEELCKCRVVWIEPNDARPLSLLLGEVPRVIVTSGWSVPAFNRYIREIRRNGGKVVAMVDNNFVLTFKECLRALRFRIFLKRKYDSFLVPGKAGRQLLQFYGVNKKKITEGIYSADSELFFDGRQLEERSKRVVYVGQFIERKNVLRLVEAFAEAVKCNEEEWELHMYGSGPLKETLCAMGGKNVFVHDFIQPEQLPEVYRNARIFCLPSLEEHWGLVVHEAALCGCILLLSRNVGAAEDFLTNGVNGFVFNPNRQKDMVTALKKTFGLGIEDLRIAQAESVRRARMVTINRFVEGVRLML